MKKPHFWTNKSVRLSIVILTAIIILGTMFVLERVFDQRFLHFKADETPIESPTVDPKSESIIAAETTQSSIPATTELPILMYHYIRDYNDSRDQIGVNLSVSPANFATQLDLINSRGYTTTTFAELDSGLKITKPIILTFDDGYQDFYDNAFPELRKRGMKAVCFIITDKDSKEYLTSSEISELSSYGIEIGSHTISHPDLSTISLARAQNEIVESKATLENIIGKPVISLCYPSGKYNENVVNLAKEAGYKYATTTNSGIGKFISPLELNRYRVSSSSNIGAFIK